MGFFNRNKNKTRAEPPPTGRQTAVNNGYYTSLSPHKSRTTNVLTTLRSIREETEALEFLKRVNPDVSMAVYNFVRLANQGHEMKFYALGGKTLRTDLNGKWREFSARVNELSNSGLDGLIDQLHYSSFLLGAQGIEVEVTPDRNDIYDIYVIKPQMIEWELKEVKGRKLWVPYQYNDNKKVYLDKQHANFFWVPTDPEIGDPRGSKNLVPVLQSIDFQLQILQDLQAVLHHQGFPRNDVSIDIEKLFTICPSHVKNDPTKLMKWMDDNIQNMRKNLESMEPDSDFVHTSDSTINTNQGANASRSLDVRAITETVDVQVLNGLKQLGTFANRSAGRTETWSTVEFLIMTQGIKSCQRGSKRMIEEVARLWLRVNGEQAIPVFTHNEVNYQSEQDRLNNKAIKQSIYAIAQLMGWIDGNVAAQEVMGAKNAVGQPKENVRASFSVGGDGKYDNDKCSGQVKFDE